MILQGNGFLDIIYLQLSNNIIVKKTDFNIIADKVMSVKIPKGLDVGNYHFNFLTIKSVEEAIYFKFKIIN